ncbi:cytochrome c family protein [Chitinophaga solisilvae]|uniref:cytochrome c family protein n=1 Tax=Chitinophaga solisilvae TaxID=1233460 RepID=UPI00136E6662|nr:cytochrome c family protein [Chitinophaga solisilvae]
MKRSLSIIVITCTALLISQFIITAFKPGNGNRQRPVSTNSCNCYASSPLYKVVINFNNKVPGDLPAFNNQSQADCFAWQEFITLNWPVDTAAYFGAPRDFSPVGWEKYMPLDVLFQPGGVHPSGWGTLVSPKYAAKFKTQDLVMNLTDTKLLTFTTKFAVDSTFRLNPDQAAPMDKPNWLGAQNNTNLWYEIKLNKDYYDFVIKNGYYNAITQHDSVRKGVPINFPQGQYNGPEGAIEIKAAWMEVDNINSPKWERYKLSKATVYDSASGNLRETNVALVGLHILHKTQNQPTWVWATFEQIDNVPDDSRPAPPYGYNFYNGACTARQVNLNGGGTATVGCTPNTSPPYYLSQAAPVPIQLTRSNAIDKADASPINDSMQNNIRRFYPQSVFQYYELVDVIWSQTLQPDKTTPIQAPFPLNISAMLSGAHIVANTTMESYVQNTNTCYSCHKFSTIAPFPADSVNNNIFGDFSFAISAAQYPVTKAKKKR